MPNNTNNTNNRDIDDDECRLLFEALNNKTPHPLEMNPHGLIFTIMQIHANIYFRKENDNFGAFDARLYISLPLILTVGL